MDERSTNYRIEESRNGFPVPVVNDIYLHSIYNPIKEAEAFAQGHTSGLQRNSNVLILGLGFGYHIDEISKMLDSYHKSQKIVIIEPNRTLAEDFVSQRKFRNTQIEILSTDEVPKLFEDIEFTNFLMNKPYILKHETSYSLNQKFYNSILSYRSPKTIEGYFNLLTPESKEIFTQQVDLSVKEKAIEIKKSRNITNKNDFLVLALQELIELDLQGSI